VAAHGESLRTVTAPESLPLFADDVTRFCRPAPLCTLRCHVYCNAAEALPLLRCEAPCALLHIFMLWVYERTWVYGFDYNSNQQANLDFAAALSSHRGKIRELTVREAPLGSNVSVADALMRGIAEARVSDVTFLTCNLASPSLPGLTRLLQAGCLVNLSILNNWYVLFEVGPDLTAFCHALRSSTLQKLTLDVYDLWHRPAVAGEFMAALVGHQTL